MPTLSLTISHEETKTLKPLVPRETDERFTVCHSDSCHTSKLGRNTVAGISLGCVFVGVFLIVLIVSHRNKKKKRRAAIANARFNTAMQEQARRRGWVSSLTSPINPPQEQSRHTRSIRPPPSVPISRRFAAGGLTRVRTPEPVRQSSTSSGPAVSSSSSEFEVHNPRPSPLPSRLITSPSSSPSPFLSSSSSPPPPPIVTPPPEYEETVNPSLPHYNDAMTPPPVYMPPGWSPITLPSSSRTPPRNSIRALIP